MNTLYYIFLALASLCAAVFTLRRGFRTDIISLLLKTAASLLFIVLASIGCYIGLTSVDGYDSASVFIITGLVFGLCGDVMLDLKYVHKRYEDIYTFAGFGSFIFGHIFYIIFMMKHGGFMTVGFIISLVIGIAAGVLIFMTEEIMSVTYGRFKIISSCYAALLIFVTAYSAFMLKACSGNKGSVMMFIGLVLFLISDLILSQIYFAEGKNIPLYKIANHAFYYAGQILIAASLMFNAI